MDVNDILRINVLVSFLFPSASVGVLYFVIN